LKFYTVTYLAFARYVGQIKVLISYPELTLAFSYSKYNFISRHKSEVQIVRNETIEGSRLMLHNRQHEFVTSAPGPQNFV
jgi:hypothetical protein